MFHGPSESVSGGWCDRDVCRSRRLRRCVGHHHHVWTRELGGYKPFYEVGLDEARPFATSTGLTRHSRNLKELLIRDFFQASETGCFWM